MYKTYLLVPVLLAPILLGAASCTLEPIKPWERDVLAGQKMQLTPYPVEAFLDDHIYFSKEAASGGSGIGGGGCGCN